MLANDTDQVSLATELIEDMIGDTHSETMPIGYCKQMIEVIRAIFIKALNSKALVIKVLVIKAPVTEVLAPKVLAIKTLIR